MTYYQIIILSAVNGLAEFLPISSSGHLVIFQKILHANPSVFFDIFVHAGTLISVLIFFRKTIYDLITGIAGRKKEAMNMALFLIIATLPTVIMGLLLNDLAENVFNSVLVVGLGMIYTGLLLVIAFRKSQSRKKVMTKIDALFVGVFQSIAIFPGISRSGSTISSALMRNLSKEKAVEFSFMLSIPAVLGALSLKLPDFIANPDFSIGQGLMSLFVAAAVGYFSLCLVKKLLYNSKLWIIGIYCFVVGASLVFLRNYSF